MQNIPGIAIEKTTEQQAKTVSFSTVKRGDSDMMFADLFDQHASKVESDLALTSVSTEEKMLDTAPVMADDQHKPVSIANEESPVTEDEESIFDDEHAREQRMTQEEFEEVRDDLEEYGMSEEEIAEIEEKVNSEEGLTWGEFVSTLAEKMTDVRKVELSDDDKDALNTFFAKLGFSEEESAKLITKIENGEQGKVLAEMQAKIDNMPKQQQLMFTKDEVQAFSTAMNFSKELTSKIKEALGQNAMAKEVKEAFTMIRQEMVDMDEKDAKLVRSVGNAFIKAMGEQAKESTAAKDLNQAVDLKPRVSEDAQQAKVAIKEDLKDVVEARKDSLPNSNAENAAKQAKKVLPEQAQADQHDMAEHGNDKEQQNNNWNSFFGKLQSDANQPANAQFQAKTVSIDASLATSLNDATQTKGQPWEKIAAPKVMHQVENAFMQNLENGTKQLTIQLTPENLGKLNIMLQVNGKEVSAVIKADNAESARIIADNIDIIKASLENEGLKVEKLEVQTSLSSQRDSQDWFGKNEHNMAREREMMETMRNHLRSMREENGTVAQDMQNVREQAINADQGLHVIA